MFLQVSHSITSQTPLVLPVRESIVNTKAELAGS